MRVMVLIKANKESEAGVLPDEQLLTAMGDYNEELVKAGVMLAGEGLHRVPRAPVRFWRGAKRHRRPIHRSKERDRRVLVVAGAVVEEAIEWVKRIPNTTGGGRGQIRPVFEMEDFGTL